MALQSGALIIINSLYNYYFDLITNAKVKENEAAVGEPMAQLIRTPQVPWSDSVSRVGPTLSAKFLMTD